MSESHDQDDLPPGKEPPHDAKFSIMLGETFGGLVGIVLLLALAGVVAWVVIGWMR